MKRKQTAFTLIELVMVMLLIGVLSVAVVPKFFGSSDVEHYTARDRVLAILRLAQAQAMFQRTRCIRVAFTASYVGIEPNTSSACGATVANDRRLQLSGVSISANGSGSDFYISFDGHGRSVTTNSGQCSLCNIAIVGSETINIRIESQGYIHAL